MNIWYLYEMHNIDSLVLVWYLNEMHKFDWLLLGISSYALNSVVTSDTFSSLCSSHFPFYNPISHI